MELQSALDVEEIAAVGPGGHLARKYTWQHVRDHVRLQRTSQDQYEAWAAGGATLFERTAQKTRELRESARPYRLEPDALRRLDELVEKARREREVGWAGVRGRPSELTSHKETT